MTSAFKKIFLAIIIVCILFTNSCSIYQPTADDIAYKLLNLYPSLPPCSQYVKMTEKNQPGYISPENFSYLYTGDNKSLPEWNLIDNFRLVISDSTSFFEIHIIVVNNSTETEEITKLLEKRKKLIDLYRKEEGDFTVNKTDIFISGKYAVLLATYDNASAINLLKKLL